MNVVIGPEPEPDREPVRERVEVFFAMERGKVWLSAPIRKR
jgi:hypothetical protein